VSLVIHILDNQGGFVIDVEQSNAVHIISLGTEIEFNLSPVAVIIRDVRPFIVFLDNQDITKRVAISTGSSEVEQKTSTSLVRTSTL
jgi:hypothetical protein